MTCTSLQRAQSALQTCRQNAQNEVKRKERELERIIERWNKVVADQQTKIGGMGANMKCANLIVDGSSVLPRVSHGKHRLPVAIVLPKGIQANYTLEKSLEQLKLERERLLEQNEKFRDLILSLAIGLDKLTKHGNLTSTIELKPITDLIIFPPSQTPWISDAPNARTVLHNLLISVGGVIDSRLPRPSRDSGEKDRMKAGELDVIAQEKLLAEVQSLRFELGR